MATYNSFIGNGSSAFQLYPLNNVKDKLSFDTKDAIPIILQQAKKEQIILLNEAHHIPAHRLLVMELLKPLKKQGYNILALECLSSQATDIEKIGFPSIKDGYYVREQTMAWLIRYAITLGYKIVPYEVPNTFCEQILVGEDCNVKREEQQAQNLNNLITQNPNDKIIALVGWAHNQEISLSSDYPRLAQILKQQYGTDPFTISQTEIYNDPITQKYNYSTFGLNNNHKGVDLVLFNNYYSTLSPLDFLKYFFKTKRKKIAITQISEHNKEVLLQIYSLKEKQRFQNKSLPVIQKVLTRNDEYFVYLPKGDYELFVRNKDDDEIYHCIWKM